MFRNLQRFRQRQLGSNNTRCFLNIIISITVIISKLYNFGIIAGLLRNIGNRLSSLFFFERFQCLRGVRQIWSVRSSWWTTTTTTPASARSSKSYKKSRYVRTCARVVDSRKMKKKFKFNSLLRRFCEMTRGRDLFGRGSKGRKRRREKSSSSWTVIARCLSQLVCVQISRLFVWNAKHS